MGAFLFFLWVALVIGGLVFFQIVARRHAEVAVSVPAEDAIARIDKMFTRLLWEDVSGPGAVNKRRRISEKRTFTISAAVRPAAQGVEVEIWVSEAATIFGLISNSLGPTLKKASMARALARLNESAAPLVVGIPIAVDRTVTAGEPERPSPAAG